MSTSSKQQYDMGVDRQAFNIDFNFRTAPATASEFFPEKWNNVLKDHGWLSLCAFSMRRGMDL
jgi:hypothetical protein